MQFNIKNCNVKKNIIYSYISNENNNINTIFEIIS